MKSTFSRIFTTVALLLLASLLLIGVIFRYLAKDYLANAAMKELETDAQVLTHLAQSAYTDNTLTNHDFIVALSVTAAAADSDAVVFDAHGKL